MTKLEFAQELEKWKQELIDEVILHYSQENEERGRLGFTRWKERFFAYLKKHVPAEAVRFQRITHHTVYVAIRGEDPLQRFIREDGKNCIAYIDDLADSAMKDRVQIREESSTLDLAPQGSENLNSSRMSEGREESGRPLIAVITALEDELDYLIDMPLDWSGPLVQIDAISYRRGHFNENIDIIATSARSMGLVASAIITAKVLKEWNPSVVAMIGVCGGRKEKGLNIGDIVVANLCFQYQFGAFENGEIARELRVENIEPRVTDIAENLIYRTRILSDIQNSTPRGFKKPNTVLHGYVGPMGSADLVVKDVKKLGDAIDADRKTIAVDMESYAFIRATKIARTRYAFVIKSVSDFADAKKDDEFRDYAKFTSTNFFYHVAKELVST